MKVLCDGIAIHKFDLILFVTIIIYGAMDSEAGQTKVLRNNSFLDFYDVFISRVKYWIL